MPNSNVRGKRLVTSQVPENEFHSIRVQEQLREKALNTLGATAQQVPVGFFVPSLQELCAEQLAENFANVKEIDALKEEDKELYGMVVGRLPVSGGDGLPLRVAVPRIVDETYWRRCCEARWSLGRISLFANEKLTEKAYGWKRLFLEQLLNDYLMSLGTNSFLVGVAGHSSPSGASPRNDPGDEERGGTYLLSADEVTALRELCSVGRDYVHTVDLPCQYAHLNFYEQLFLHVPSIVRFRLTYGVASAGIAFSRGMVGFSENDAQVVRQILRRYTALEVLRLPLNGLQSSHVRMIASGLVENISLRVLDLSQNRLTDDAVEPLALLLYRQDFPLEELHLGDNELRNESAVLLADMIAVNKTLQVLSLEANKIGDAEGGAVLVRAIPFHPSLTELYLGNNRLGTHTAEAICEVLPSLTSLRVLHLAGNAMLGGGYVDVEADEAVASRDDLNGNKGPAYTTKRLQTPLKSEAAVAVDNFTAAIEQQQEQQPESPKTRTPHTTSPTKASEGDSPSIDVHYEAPRVQQSLSGPRLLDAIRSNTSLTDVDTRFCGFTKAEEDRINEVIRERIFSQKMANISAAETEQFSTDTKYINTRVARTTGRYA